MGRFLDIDPSSRLESHTKGRTTLAGVDHRPDRSTDRRRRVHAPPCRNFATISSGLGRFLDIDPSSRLESHTKGRTTLAGVDHRPPGTIGRPRTKGARLPTLAASLVAKDTRWHAVVVSGWYGSAQRAIEVASGTAVWRHGGMPVVPIRSRARA
ncbi:hypothetical protein [Methylobacterium sp. Leaf361]|uniref:hypothetical protein n=1 Tax=Methylobacterium sp. Leaf361 TaxID=1736352 RepID=UPI001FCE2EA3|nr:hypothetical protein [Methylobacterium sp. Leaf361]